MYEGFSNYDAFAYSIGDGFTNCLNDFMPRDTEDLLCNADGGSALSAAFGKLSTKRLRAVDEDKIKRLQAYLTRSCGLNLSKKRVLVCLRGALNQSTGNPDLDNF